VPLDGGHGATCCLKVATGEPDLNCGRSQTLRAPSSPPLSRKGSQRLQLMTLTSLSWAVAVVSMQALLGAARMSQIRMEASTEQEANTVSSVGDHCKSSTEHVWPTKGRWSTCQEPPSVGVQRWIFF
jgi:hypothetical protein